VRDHPTVSEGGQTLQLRDGRRLGFAEYGRPDGQPCFYFHGHPGSRLEAELAHEVAASAGIRVLALDRPGYGLSDFEPGRTILSWPRDVEAAADLFGLDRIAVLGASGGGPYALACGCALPERVSRIGLISSIAPYQATGVTKGMRWQNRVGFQAGARFPPLARLIMWSMARQLRRDPERTVDAIVSAMSPSDAEVARRPEIRELLRADVTEAFRHGSRGAAGDVVLLGTLWGFGLEEVRPPVLLWQGESDVLATPAMGRHLAKVIPDCRATFYPDEGHLLAFEHMPEIIRAFAAD
jgi:pimeloyl-ACP methyl ester carboxylesterase